VLMVLPAVMCVAAMPAAAQEKKQVTGNEWQDLQVNEVNRLPMHTRFLLTTVRRMPCGATSGSRDASSR